MNAHRPETRLATPLPRGRGMLAIGLVVAVWGLMRVAFWESPLLSDIVMPLAAAETNDATASQESVTAEAQIVPVDESAGASVLPWQETPLLTPLGPTLPNTDWHDPAILQDQPRPAFQKEEYGANRVLGHANLLRMGFATPRTTPRLPTPVLAQRSAQLPIYDTPSAASELRATPVSSPVNSRWSLDAWALWREGGNLPLVAGNPSYGRSQAGAVLRYTLAEASGFRPQLYLRATSALEGAREREVAFGASARPLPSLPVRFAAESRLSETAGGTEVRAAGYAVTELPPLDLPGGITAEAYAQAGYVTGNDATAFVDGQARATRPVIRHDDFRLEAGAGAWGGAQDDAARLDIGPSAAVTFRIGETNGRVSADYRFRVAGDAEPRSGPAITLSASF